MEVERAEPDTEQSGAGRERAPTRSDAADAGSTAATPLINQAGQLRFVSVESLRAVGALGVVIAQVWGAAGGSFYDSFVDRLKSGIGFGAFFFFALTGALLYLPFAKRDFGGGRRITLGRYAMNRALRIFPLYFACLFVVMVLLYGENSLQQWVRWGLFLENFWPREILEVNGVFWTVVIELHFYILLPLIAWLIARTARGSIRKAALVLLALGLLSYAVRLKYWLIPDTQDKNEYIYFSLLSTFFLVAAGMLVSLLVVHWQQRGRPAWVRGWRASSDVWMLSAVPLWLIVIVDYNFDFLLAPASFLVLAACLLPLEGRRVCVRILEWKWIAILGLGAYSIYVWHVPLIHELTDTTGTDHTGNSLQDNYWLLMAITLPLICIVSMISYRLIEEPALRLRRRWSGAGKAAETEAITPTHAAPAPRSAEGRPAPASPGAEP